MEDWQRLYSRAKRVELTDYIECQPLFAHFQAANILESEDIERIKSKSTKREKSELLLDILETRTGSYSALTKACHQCCQTGALLVLLQGYKEQCISNPLSKCGINIDFHKILATKVDIQNRSLSIREAFQKLSVKNLEEIFISEQLEHDYIDIFMFPSDEPIKIVKDPVPCLPPVYIQRSVSNRLQLSAAIFKVDCQDMFVFRGIERFELSNLASPNPSSRSSEQIFELTSRFILLVTDEDWDELRTLAEAPMHLVRYENETGSHFDKATFILEDTTGNSTILWNFVSSPSHDKNPYVGETEFVKKLIDNPPTSGICICDTPGMGKTYLLASIARKIGESNGENIVAYFRLSEFTSKSNIFQTSVTMTPFLAFDAVLSWMCDSKICKAILLKAVNENWVKLELFFDGLDEVLPEKIDRTKSFLKNLVAVASNIRIFVTSRPHLRRQLESTLGVISYDIHPFTEKNQENFLVESWKRDVPRTSEPTMRHLATKILTHFRKHLNRNEHDMFGIPLLCYLLAEVYKREAKLLSNPKRNLENMRISELSVFDLFKRFMEMRFNSYQVDFSKIYSNEASQASGSAQAVGTIGGSPKPKKPKLAASEEISSSCPVTNSNDPKMNMRYHTWQALSQIFPNISDEYKNKFPCDVSETVIFSTGILEHNQHEVGDTTRFVHRTFAEYFVAQFFTDILLGIPELLCDEFVRLAVNDVLVGKDFIELFVRCKWCGTSEDTVVLERSVDILEFRHTLIVSFIDMFLRDSKQQHVISQPLQQCLHEDIDPSKLFGMLNACAHSNLVHLFRYMKNTLEHCSKNLVQDTKWHILHGGEEILKPAFELLYLSSQHPVQMIIECFNLLCDCFHYKPELVTNNKFPPNFCIPLHRAVQLANYEVLEHLVGTQKISVEGRQLSYYCVENSYGESNVMVEKRLQILQYLIHNCKSLLLEEAYMFIYGTYTKYESPLFADKIHLKIFKYFIDILAASDPVYLEKLYCDQDRTIIHKAAVYMSPNDFDEICRYLIEDCKAAYIFTQYQTPNYILHSCRNLQSKTLSRILDIPGITLNDQDEYGNNVILSAVIANQSLEIVQNLVSLGANFTCKNNEGKSAIHIAARHSNKEMVAYFLSLGLSLEDKDNKGYTPLILSQYNLDMIKYLVAMGSDIRATINTGETTAHMAALVMPSADDFHELVLLISEKLNAPEIFEMIPESMNDGTPLYLRLFEFNTYPIHLETIRYILKEIPRINPNQLSSDEENSLLHAAVLGKRPVSILNELVKCGVDVNLMNKYGKTAVDLASRVKYKEAIQYFESIGVE